MTKFRRLAAPALLLAMGGVGAGCSDMNAPAADAPAQYITIKRHWNSGERDSLIAHVMATHASDDTGDVTIGNQEGVFFVRVIAWERRIGLVIDSG